MADHSSPSWLDAQLRETPLPEGLLERLRAIARQRPAQGKGAAARVGDEAIDHLLRCVAIPEGLVARIREAIREESVDEVLREIPVPDGLTGRVRAAVYEEAVDDLVCEVTLPDGLVARVQAMVAEEAEEESLDEAISAIDVPMSVLAKSRIVPYLRSRPHPVLRGVAAAALFVMISVSYLTMVAAVVQNSRPAAPITLAELVINLGPLELDGGRWEDHALFIEVLDRAPNDVSQNDLPMAPVEIHYAPTRGPAGELALAFEQGFQPFQNTVLAHYQPLGAQWAEDDLPSLETISLPGSPGVEPPLVRGFDRVFLYKYGAHPLVNPAADPVLASSTTTLTTSTVSFDLTEHLVWESRTPDPRDVRVEEFLAALAYDFPLPGPDQVQIRAAAGPSVFGSTFQGLRPQLLQVAAQAGPAGYRESPVTHLTVAVDISASMNWSGRIEMARRALTSMLDHLGPHDRLALVAFNEEVVYLVEDASRNDRTNLLDTIARLRPRGGTNIDVGLRQAMSLSLGVGVPSDAARRVVLLTDGRIGLPPADAEIIEDFLRDGARQGIRLDVIDLSRQEEFPEYMTHLAVAGGGQVRRGDSADAIRWGLVEALLGQSPLVASGAQLTVTFNPEAVAAYRLVGHEPTLAGLASQNTTGELRNLEAATALYEVWLKPGEVDDVAVAELKWIDAHTGQAQQRRQRISRIQFAPSLAESPLSLQAATLAARTAEVLRESVFVPVGARDFGNILDVAAEVNSQLAEQESFRRFVVLVNRLHELTTLRTP